MSPDWFSMGILATGLPLALQNFGPWFGMNAIFLVGVFVLPRILPEHQASVITPFAIMFGGAVFLYANYGGVLPLLPTPSTGPRTVATFTLGDDITRWLVRLVNSLMFAPAFGGAFGVFMNHLLTRPKLTETAFIRHALPRRDPDLVVTSTAFGTAFYLTVVTAAIGQLIVLP